MSKLAVTEIDTYWFSFEFLEPMLQFFLFITHIAVYNFLFITHIAVCKAYQGIANRFSFSYLEHCRTLTFWILAKGLLIAYKLFNNLS